MVEARAGLRLTFVLGLVLSLGACDQSDDDAKTEPVVRGLRTVVVKDVERSTTRKYPGVLQPASISTLSFQVSGQLTEVRLDVGQHVKKGQVLAKIDPKSLTLQVENAEAAVRQAESSAETAKADYERKLALQKKGVVSQAALDQAKNSAATAAAKLVQAKKQHETARDNLTKSELKAPYDGIVNTVEVKSFANVTPGAPVVTVYSASNFEASFSVSYDVINQLVVGKKATIRLADSPDLSFSAHVSQIGAKADTVSSFPVVVALDETSPVLKAGMAIEIALGFKVETGKGYLLPLSVLALQGYAEESADRDQVKPGKVFVYVFDEATSTVKRREITVAGIRENALIVVDGVKPGDRVASAGVSFLREGQAVKLLPAKD